MDDSGGLTYETAQRLEDAVNILWNLPEDQQVYFTGADEFVLRHLETTFKRNGLEGLVFIPIHDIISGRLRGCKGVLLIDDFKDIPQEQKEMVLSEQRVMNRAYLDRRLARAQGRRTNS